MNIVVIDSGLNQHISNVQEYSLRIIDDKIIITDSPDNHNDHCDVVLRIIHENSQICKNKGHVNFIVLNILDHNLRCRFLLLEKALQLIETLEDISIVHMSLTYTGEVNRKKLYDRITSLANRKILVICSSLGNKSYPAAFPEVISVVDYNTTQTKEYSYNPKDIVISDLSKHDYIPFSCPSYAAPLITAKVIDYIHQQKEPIAMLYETIINKKPFM